MKTAASYLCGRYEETYDQKIDEMKLHKLMYFAQRENLIRTGEPLFDAEFQGWRFGPVLPALREVYKANDFAPLEELELGADQAALDAVFDEYAETDSWNLSLLSHGEICWKRSRKGIAPHESSSNPIPLEDIRADADRMQKRRALLEQGLL
jgi:uncharacterized phage-associated protein